MCVREGGLEPPRRKAQEPKSCVSANFTTRARGPHPEGMRQRSKTQVYTRGSSRREIGGVSFRHRFPTIGLSGAPALLRVDAQVATQLCHVAGRAHIVLGHRNNALLVNHEGRTNQALVHAAVILLLTPRTVGLSYRVIGI